ncbi:MAG: HAD family phosphatase [Deltaproteobacteria bacterium]|jgi:putative hydrolase of the HAD superfamily
MNTEIPCTTLFLDIGGVLLTNGWGHQSRALAAKTFGFDYEEMESRHRMTFNTYEIGKISLDKYLQRVVFYEKRSFTREQFREFMFAQSKRLPDMIDYIRRLKKRYGVKIAVVSNEGRELNDYRIRTFKLGEFVDFFISSSYVRFRKPDEDIFRIALDVAQVLPENAVYIDDRHMFVQVASELGIKGLHHTSYQTTREALAACGLRDDQE